MNRSQLASVALGVVIFLVGALLAVRTLAGAPGGTGSSLGPLQASAGTLVVAAAVTALGVAVALLGTYLTRDRG